MDLRSGIVTLTTDFGPGLYVAAMKAVILSTASRVMVVDLTHDVSPQNVLDAGFVLAGAARLFPAGTVHCAVVDPGVGTSRRILLVEAAAMLYLAPDNGLLTLPLDLETPSRAWSVENDAFFRRPLNPTFHGRDVFAPVAAALVGGERPEAFGPAVDPSSVKRLPLPPVRATKAELKGEVIFVDRFGNLVTNIPSAMLEEFAGGASIEVRLGRGTARGLVRTYGETALGKVIALVGSLGYLEIAVTGASAARALAAKATTPVTVRRSGRPAAARKATAGRRPAHRR